MERDCKLQNELKVKTQNFIIGEPLHLLIEKTIKGIFEGEDNPENIVIDFDLRKDWNLSFGIKTDPEGITTFTGSLKMVDNYVTGKQLSIFKENFLVNVATGEIKTNKKKVI